MKICYIANSDISHTAKWVSYFVEKGHEVHVISHRDTPIPGAKVYYLDYNIKNFILMASEVHKIIKKIKPDVLHAHQANTCGLYAASMKGYDFMVSAWGSDILVAPKKSPLMKWIVKYVLKRAKYITSDAEYMSDEIIRLGGDKNNVYTFPMGVEEEIFEYKHLYKTESPELNIISIRKLEKIYRIDILIRGFYEALKVRKNMNLTIAASGSQEQKLKNLVLELGIEKKVKFTGRYNPDKVGKLLVDNDVFVSIPESDSTSVSLLEGMAVGLFPVLSDLPGNREWVCDGANGLILDKTTPENVKNAILWCADNKDKLIVAGEKNIDIIKEKAVWKNNAAIVEELYRSMCK